MGRPRGQSLVEFALILPLLLFIIFFIIEMARLLHAYLEVENGARFGVRYAVTGEFNNTYCSGFPGAVCDSQPETDAARIPSIEDAARAGSASVLRDETLSPGQPGFFIVTVCSNKGGVVYFPSDSNTATPADCQPAEDAGGPGDRVSVTVDFDHPLIAPVLSSWWPSLHLTAKREGIVEQFRTSRVVGLPATIAVPTFTPTSSFTPSITPTPSDTPTPTETPTPTSTSTPTQTYTPSFTPTTTSSPTLTPTPDCSRLQNAGISFTTYRDIRFVVRNNNPMTVTLTNAYVDWTKAYGSQYLDYLQFNGNTFYGGNDSTPPTSSGASRPFAGGGNTDPFIVRFGSVPSNLGLDGTFTVVLTFDNSCVVSATISRAAPTITLTPTPSDTPTPSNTPTPSRTPTNTLTPTRTFTPSITPTASRTPTPTITQTPSRTPTRTATPSITPTPSRTPTRTPTNTRTPTSIPTIGATSTSVPSATPTITATLPIFG